MSEPLTAGPCRNLSLTLRGVREEDLLIFFEHQRDPVARWMAAFVARDPDDREAFMLLWQGLLAEDVIRLRTVLLEDRVAGCVMGYEEAGRAEVSYWIGQAHWGMGVATAALQLFMTERAATDGRPLYARAAKDNAASLRVLEKCGFAVVGEGKGFANARGAETEEWVLKRE